MYFHLSFLLIRKLITIDVRSWMGMFYIVVLIRKTLLDTYQIRIFLRAYLNYPLIDFSVFNLGKDFISIWNTFLSQWPVLTTWKRIFDFFSSNASTCTSCLISERVIQYPSNYWAPSLSNFQIPPRLFGLYVF